MIPLANPPISKEGIDDVTELLTSGQLSVGNVVPEFESSFTKMVECEYGVAVASGSVALELALEAIFEKGDTVALSPYNCGAMLYSVLRTGLEPVFVDSESETGALSAEELRNTAVDGVLLSHMYGHPAAIDDILAVADSIGAHVVEDVAQTPGATINNTPVGSIGRAGVCSFGATKNLTTAEGGMVVTDAEEIADYVANQRTNTHDVTPPPRSVRMNDIEAAIGLSQLDSYEETLVRKRSVAGIYRAKLAEQPVELLDVQPWATNVYHAFPVLHPEADALAAHLRDRDIGTSRLYETPLHEYDAAPPSDDEYPVAERFAAEVVLLPIHGQVTDSQARTVADAVVDFCANQ